MAPLIMRKNIVTFALVGILALAFATNVMCQNVANIVTPQFFDSIKNQAAARCAGRRFYTRDAFLNAANAYRQFGSGSPQAAKREIAAFFAHVTHETGHFCYVEEINKYNRYCDEQNQQYPCVPGKFYYGRGPIQLTGNGDYGAAGKAIGFDGLRAPETVARDPVVSFKTALWFWMTYVHPVMNQGFGATIQRINGAVECGGKQPAQVQARNGYYKDYCNKFGVAPGPNLYC
ncbi:hypothetical protein WN944_015989 [Citrus x changshan-huyou]|uniref:chitinase n=1 Tax=Citrus x changshan-huyou TaxID=2935761 RepID=A0AAP0MEZ3_9ROSI